MFFLTFTTIVYQEEFVWCYQCSLWAQHTRGAPSIRDLRTIPGRTIPGGGLEGITSRILEGAHLPGSSGRLSARPFVTAIFGVDQALMTSKGGPLQKVGGWSWGPPPSPRNA